MFLVLFTTNENITIIEYASGMRLPKLSKLAINWKNDNYVTVFDITSSTIFFWRCFASFINFIYWSKFRVNIVTGSRVMTIFFYRRLTRNLEIGSTHVWIFPISENWSNLRMQNLVQMFLIKSYWMFQNARVTAFKISEL